jgi:hypothetical protein
MFLNNSVFYVILNITYPLNTLTLYDRLNVVLVSLPDKFLEETTNSLKANFPKQKFISVPAKFDHKTDYMPAIIEVSELTTSYKNLY